MYFLIFRLLHSLDSGDWECISWFFSICTLSLWTLGSVFLDFWTYALSLSGLEGVETVGF